MGAQRYTAEQVIAVLKETKGMVYLAARRLGCTPVTVYNYIERHPTIKITWKAERGKVVDTAELALYNAILNNEHWAVTFALATIGKDRGYTKRTEQEITGKDGGPVEHKIIRVLEYDEE